MFYYFSFSLNNCKAPWAYGYGAIEILSIIINIIIFMINALDFKTI